MKPDPTRVARIIHQTANLARTNAHQTQRLVDDWAGLGHAATPTTGSTRTIGDPTGSAAINPPPTFADLADRWTRATRTVNHYTRALVGYTNPGLGARLDIIATVVNAGTLNPTTLQHIYALALELEHIMYETAPIQAEQADETAREHAHTQAISAGVPCQACDSPADRLINGWCEPCRKLAARNPEHAGDRNDYRTWVCARIAQGTLHRPNSPHHTYQGPPAA